MARESFLFRTNPEVLNALRKWADDEFRSANGQLEFLVRQALQEAGRLPDKKKRRQASPEESEDGEPNQSD